MSQKQVVTRFAPSPTGYLHIGGARTALFNWLYAKSTGGKFLLRIEDTDRERSTHGATDAILNGLKWLGLDWDGAPFSQHANIARHQEVAQQLLDAGKAYKCFSTKEEIESWRAENETPFQSPWRDADAASHPDAPFAIRLRCPREGGVVIKDKVQKKVSWAASSFDDLILLRSDGTPTYMLAVVVDDHDMGVTHIIRGDDHLINAGRQSLIFAAMGWDVPEFAHIPLIHGEDGKKLSKRHGATGVEEYAAMGYMPEAMRNYLARLGWSHGNDELFTTQQAIEWFDFAGLGKSPSRLDFKKLDNVSAHHIKTASDDDLVTATLDYANSIGFDEAQADKAQLAQAVLISREKSRKLDGLWEKAQFLFNSAPQQIDADARSQLNSVSIGILKELTPLIEGATWTSEQIMMIAKDFVDQKEMGLGKVGMPLKAALSGQANSPSAFAMMEVLGQEESLKRIHHAITSV